MSNIHTARITYKGADRVDITRKGGSMFGPSWPLLMHHIGLRRDGKETEETWQEYVAAYMQEMRLLWIKDSKPFRDLAGRDATLVCYCTSKHCHRFLLAEILVKLGATYLGERSGGV